MEAEGDPAYDYGDLEQLYIDKAYAELNEDSSGRIYDGIAHLRNWLQKSSHIKNCPDSDAFLLRFLRVAKFDLENAVERLANFCTIRGSHANGVPSMFVFPSLEEVNLRTFLRSGVEIPCGYNDKGEVVLLSRIKNWNPSEISYSELLRYVWMGIDVLVNDQRCQIGGLTVVVDMDGLSMGHITSVLGALRDVKDSMRVWQCSYPMRHRDVFFYKEPWVFDLLFSVIRFWMTPTLLSRIHRVRADLSAIHEQMTGAQRVLPAEYGGDNGTVDELIDRWEQRFYDYWSKPIPLKDLEVEENLAP